MFRFLTIISILFLLISCNGKKEEVIDLSDRIPKSDRNYDEVDSSQSDPISKQFLPEFKELWPETDSLRLIGKREFIDRFRPASSQKFTLFQQGDSLHYMRWSFEDSVKTKNAFYNWLDHKRIDYFGSEEVIQKEAFSMLYADTVILFVSGKFDLENWRETLEEKEIISEGDVLIEQKKYGRAKWYRLTEEELKPITEK